AIQGTRATAAVPGNLLAQAKQSIGAALIGARQLSSSNPRAAALLDHTARAAFFHGFKGGVMVSAVIATIGAVLGSIILPAHPTETLDDELSQLVTATTAPDHPAHATALANRQPHSRPQ